jgi:hypothetical protein
VSSEAELVSVELECVKRRVSHKFRFRAIVVSENPVLRELQRLEKTALASL